MGKERNGKKKKQKKEPRSCPATQKKKLHHDNKLKEEMRKAHRGRRKRKSNVGLVDLFARERGGEIANTRREVTR